MLDRADTTARLDADCGYHQEANRRLLARHGWRGGIARKAQAGCEPGPRARARNNALHRRRARVEHVFAQLRHLGGKAVRAVTLARHERAIALKCAADNIKRLVRLEAQAAAV